jgi:SRSO17 transposase
MAKTHIESEAAIAQARQWADGLDEVASRIGRRFPRSEPRQQVLTYVRGLLSPVERKNGWQLAEQAGQEAPYATQHLLGRAVWSADAVRDDLRAYVVEHLGEADGVLVIDETGFPKKGTKSVGVQRQYCGTAGRIENCQVGVFLGYATRHGRTFLDRELYLPQAWASDQQRRTAASIPPEVQFATKLVLARRMVARAQQAGVPFRWVTGDEVYGSDSQMRSWLEKQGISYVLAVSSQYQVWFDGARRGVAEIAGRFPPLAWHQMSAGAGATGERLDDGAVLPLGAVAGQRQRWLLCRRSLSAPQELAYDVVSAPQQTPPAEMVRVAGTRWAIEESVQSAKGEGGLDHYEVRSWAGWYRHVTLALLAHADLTVTRARAGAQAEHGPKKRPLSAKLRPMTSYR